MNTKLLLLLGLLLAIHTRAATRSWTGLNGSRWSNPNNWSPNGTPQPGEDLEFIVTGCGFCSRDMTNDLNNLVLGRLFFEKNAYTLSGNPLTLNDQIYLGRTGPDASTTVVTIHCALTLGANVDFVANYGNGGVSKLNLTGPINLNGFDLHLQTEWAFDSAEIHVMGVISGTGNVSATVHQDCTIEMGGPSGNTFTGTLTASSFVLGYGGPVVLSKQSGAAVNTRLEIMDGTVRLERPNQIADGAIVLMDEGELDFQDHDETFRDLEMVGGDGWNHEQTTLNTGTGTLTLLGSVTSRSTPGGAPIIKGRLALNGDHTLDISGTEFYGLDLQADISGGGDLTKTGTASLILSGNNTFTQWLLVEAGSVEPRTASALGSVSRGVSLRGGSLRLINLTISGEALYSQADNATLFSLGTSTWAGEIRLERQLQVYGENLTHAHAITGPGGLLLLGGTITLGSTEQNAFTGATEVRCELLRLNKPSNTRAFAGPLVVGGGFAPLHEVRWLNSFQQPPGANVTIQHNGLLSLNDFTDIVSNLTFNGGHVNLATDSALQITGTVTSTPTNVTALIDGATGLGSFFLSGQRTFNIGDGSVVGPDLRIDARIAGSGITKLGEGTLALGGNNAFGGPVNIGNGILRVDHDNGLGTIGAGTTVSHGATLVLANTADLVREPVTLNGAGFGGTNGALLALGAVVLSNNVALATPSTIRVDSPWQLKMDGIISGTGPLTKIGAGTLTFAGTANNTFTGHTLVNAGTLQLDKSDFLQAVPGNLVIGGTGLRGSTSATVRHFSQDQVWAHVTVNAGSLLDLNGYEEYLLTLTLNEGGDVQTGAGLLTVDPGNSISVNPGIGFAVSTISGRLGLRTGNHNISVAPFVLALGGGPELDVPAQVVFYNGIANLHKNGSGNVRLAGSNTFTGALYVDGGSVIAANNAALGATQGSTVVQTNGTLVLDDGITTGDFLILDSAAFPSLVSLSGSNVVNAGINLLRPNNGIEVQPASGYLQVLGQVGSVGGLTKLGPGTLQFWGRVGNTYTGLTVISNGVIEADRSDPLLRINRVSIPGNFTIGDDSTAFPLATLRALRAGQVHMWSDAIVHRSGLFDLLTGASASLRRICGEGRVNLASLTSVTVSNDVPFTFPGSISGSGAFNKYGPEVMILEGDSPFFGPTTIYQGNYRMNGRATNSPVTVKRDGSLNGDGVVGDVTVETNGNVGPVSAVRGRYGGDLEMSSAYFYTNAFLSLHLWGGTPIGINERLIVNGPVNLNTTRLTGSTGFYYAPHEGEVITLIDKRAPGPVLGAFNGYPQGTLRTLGEIPVVINYTGGDGNDVTLTVTNVAAGAGAPQVSSGNGNGLIEPDECNLLFLGVRNRRNTAITLRDVLLRSTTSNALVTIASAAYPIIPSGSIRSNLTPFQIRTLPTHPCGAAVTVELQVTVAGEGTFAIPFNLLGGTNCTNGGGACESCTIVSGTFTTNTPTMPDRFYFTTGPSECLPPKPCPGPDPDPNLPPARYLTHSFTNSTTNELCVTVQVRYPCASPPLNALGAAAYLDAFDPGDLCSNYLGDSGAFTPLGYLPFSFRIPGGSNFVVVVSEWTTNLVCADYTLELFGLPCPPPTLCITQDTSPLSVLLQWSSAYPGWRLQSTNALSRSAPNAFSDVAASPILVEGRYTVTNLTAGPPRFFRLRQP